jgi:hypothetical protein
MGSVVDFIYLRSRVGLFTDGLRSPSMKARRTKRVLLLVIPQESQDPVAKLRPFAAFEFLRHGG